MMYDDVRRWASSEFPGCTEHADSSRISFTVADVTPWTVEICVLEDSRSVVVYSTYPSLVEPSSGPVMSELVTIANRGLVHGNFEFDQAAGVVRYKTSLFGGESIDEDALSATVAVNQAMMTAWAPTIACVSNGMSVETALELIEPESPSNLIEPA